MLFTEHHDLRVPGIALYRYRFGRNRPEAGIWDETRNNVLQGRSTSHLAEVWLQLLFFLPLLSIKGLTPLLLEPPSLRSAPKARTCGPTSKPKILELARKDDPIVSDDWTSNKLKLVYINRRFPWHFRMCLSASGHRGLIVSDNPTLLSSTTVKNDMAIKRSQDTDINI